MENEHRDSLVFKALADPTRRALLDRLRREDGQNLSELSEGTGVSRQTVTQHLDVLVSADLVSVEHVDRRRLHYINPVPIHRLQSRWLNSFDQPRLDALQQIRTVAEEAAMSENAKDHTRGEAPDTAPSFVYVTYIEASAEQVWEALTDADVTARYWGHRNTSTWEPGAVWEHLNVDGGAVDVTGRVLESDRPRTLRISFEDPTDFPGDDPGVVTFSLAEGDGVCKLTVRHENLSGEAELRTISNGWWAILANLKTLLESGEPLKERPWEMEPRG